jgi:KamA family protein
MAKIKYIRDINVIEGLSDIERSELSRVCDQFQFRANDYYLSLIDWDDPNDPIRRIIIPHTSELEKFGELDASDEESNYVVPGCQHKYTSTALLMCNEVCGGYCRFCFRKRLFMDENDEAVNDLSEGIEYIRENEQITNVLLTGGDPFLMSTRKLEKIIRPLRKIDHVNIIRIGTKMPAFNPFRIIDDPELPNMLTRYSTRHKRIYVMTHLTHARELTDEACLALDLLMKAGTVICNQTPVLKGINSTPESLEQLMRSLSDIGVNPYYFFQCRPTAGNIPYVLTLTEAFQIFEEAKRNVSGLAKRARLVMSHSLGKTEILGLSELHMYLKFHRSRYSTDKGRFLIYHRDDNAYWLDDLVPVEEAPHPVARFGHKPAHAIGPE